MKPIILRTRTSTDECIGTVRLTPEAEKVVRRLRFKTGLPIVKLCLKSSSRRKTSLTSPGMMMRTKPTSEEGQHVRVQV